MVCTMAGWRGLVGVWLAVFVCGVSFAVVQFAIANFMGAALVDVIGGIVSLLALALFLQVWQPRDCWQHDGKGSQASGVTSDRDSVRTIAWAWAPWAFLSAVVFLWGLPPVTAMLEGRTLGGNQKG